MFSSIVNKLQDIVAKYPEKIAIIIDKQSFSYSNLWTEIISCAINLKKMCLNSGDRVALLLNNSVEYVSSYYGVIACGGIVVALNTSAKSTDIINWLKHSGTKILITDNNFYKHLESNIENDELLDVIIIHTENNTKPGLFWSQSTNYSGLETFHPEIVSSSTPVSIIYTSGTTGHPKGVTLSHGNYVANLSEVINYLELTSDDSILNILPFYYSYGNSVLHTHLLVGAMIVLENSFMYPAQALQKIVDHKITGFSGVPATYSILLNRINLDEFDLSSLRYVTQAGGPMPPYNIHKFVHKMDSVKFFVMYGQTEATARLTYLDPDILFRKLGSIGKPLNGIDIQIRDEDNNILEADTEGELYVSGPNIMSGYWENKALTNQVLINNYLKTGDLGYMDNEGYIYLTGRRSDMIKVGGNRISPLEIEEAVVELDGIEEVAATGVDDEILGQVVKLTVVVDKNTDITEKIIKAYCRNHFAIYKIPKYINFVDSLPKTTSGKIQRFLL